MCSGKLVATSSGDHTVRLWESASAKGVSTFKGHGLPVWYVDWHWSGNFVASASMDGSVKIWDLNRCVCALCLCLASVSIRLIWRAL